MLRLLLCGLGAGAQPVTLQSLLEEMTNRDDVARFPQPSCQALTASSYNRASYNRNQPDQTFSGWFADSDGTGFIRTETNAVTGNTEWVIMEHEGPGCITRIWTPFFYYDFNDRVGPNVRVYLDGSSQPVFDESLIHLVTAQGSIAYPFAAYTARAGDLYLPIPFSNSCKVTMTAASFYYNVACRAYAAGTPVETFTLSNYQALATLRSNVASFLTAPQAAPSGVAYNGNFKIAAGASTVVSLPAGPAAIRQFTVELPASATNPACLRSTVLTMTFDGEQTVLCPVGDFFSSADSVHSFQNLQKAVTTNGTMTCSWVMPYESSGGIEILNEAAQAVTVALRVTTDPWSWDARSMHFHANWRPDDIVAGTPPSDWNFIDIQGQGVYVGDSWTVLNIQTNSWWGEGAEKIYVDAAWQAGFPTQYGTGSEDYYGWAGGVLPARSDEFSHPFLSNVRVGGLDGSTVGYNVNTRTRNLDSIPFTQRLVFDMESSFGTSIRNPWDLLGYAVATYWYALPGATNNRPPQLAAAGKPIMSLSQLQQVSDAIQSAESNGQGPGARWNLGEQDAGATAGTPGNAITKDAIGTNDLSSTGEPIYSANVPGGGSALSMSFDGASCYQSAGAGALYEGIGFNRFSLSCDVYMTALGKAGFSFPVSLGATSTGGGGLALVEIGGAWEIIHHMVQETSGSPAVALNTWTHLELMRKDFGSGVQTRLLVNGADAGLSLTSAPNVPPGIVTVGANPNPSAAGGLEGYFNGQIDNVVLQNLNPVIASGPAVSPSSALVPTGGSFTLSVVATGESPLYYLWRKDGVSITNWGTSPSVTRGNVMTNQTGNYDMIITNAYGAVTSAIVAVSVLPPGVSASAVVAQYDLGEDDPGAVAGNPGDVTTTDLIGTNNLISLGTPSYSSNVPPDTGSTLSMFFNGASCCQGAGTGISNLVSSVDWNNFSLSFDVYMTAPGAQGFSFPVSVGGSGPSPYGGGVTAVEIGGHWELVHNDVVETSGGPAIPTNAWQHVNLARENFAGSLQTRLYIDGVDSGLSITAGLLPTPPYFTIGGNENPSSTATAIAGIEGLFNGNVDNVVLRSFNRIPATLSLTISGGVVNVECMGPPGFSVALLRTPSLSPASWVTVQSGALDANGHLLLADPYPPAAGAFYKTAMP